MKNGILEAITIDANSERLIITNQGKNRVSVMVKDEFFTNAHGKVINHCCGFTLRKSGKWIRVAGTQELINFNGVV